MDKKITELATATSIQASDVSVLVHNDADLQFSFATLLSFLGSNLALGAAISFGTTLPQNNSGKNGDVFFNTAASAIAQKVSGIWTVVYTLPASGGQTDSTVLYGLGAPASVTGNNNDTYINTGTGMFYKKTSGTWSPVFTMLNGPAGARGEKGDKGDAGQAGRTILNGNTNPFNLTDGSNGDYYINTATFTIFGPKTNGTWDAGVSLIGPGVINGGTTGQILRKASDDDGDTFWDNEQDISGKADTTYVDNQNAIITAQIDAVATDIANNTVKTTGDQTVDGVKTFDQKITGSIDNAMQWNGQLGDLSTIASGIPHALAGLNTESGQWESYLADAAFIQNQAASKQVATSWSDQAYYGGDDVNGPNVIVSPGGVIINPNPEVSPQTITINSAGLFAYGFGTSHATLSSNGGRLSLQNGGNPWSIMTTPTSYNDAIIIGTTRFVDKLYSQNAPSDPNEVVRLSDLDTYSLDVDVVHRSGAEMLTGQKTFSQRLNLQDGLEMFSGELQLEQVVGPQIKHSTNIYQGIQDDDTWYIGRPGSGIKLSNDNTLRDLSGVAYAKVSDIPPASSYIQNQSSTLQTADFKISGSGSLDGELIVGGALNAEAMSTNNINTVNIINSGDVYSPKFTLSNTGTSGNKIEISAPNITAGRNINFPDNSGTVALVADVSAGYVPITRVVAGFPLSGDITLASHSAGTGLAGTSYNGSAARTWFATLSTGIAGGQTVVGGTNAGDNLTIATTTNGTKGKIVFGNSAYDEANNRLGIGTSSPEQNLHVNGTFLISSNGFTGLAMRSARTVLTDNIGGFRFVNSANADVGGVYGTVGGDVKIAVGSSSAFGITALNNGNVGVGFAATAPTHTLTLGPGNTGIVSYNNAAGLDAGVTNYERIRTVWGGNVYNVISEAGGTGAARTIRTATPTSLFDVGAQEVRYSQYNANPGIVVSRYNGTIASPTQILSGQQIGGFYLNGYTSAGAIGSNVGAFQFFATENFTGTAQGTRFAIAVTPTGSTGRIDRLTIENDGATTVNGNLTSNQFKLSALNTAPASASATGTTGEIRVTAGYIYVCVATNTWVRSALTTW